MTKGLGIGRKQLFKVLCMLAILGAKETLSLPKMVYG